MMSKAADVPAYIADLPVERRPAIEKLRSLCRQQFKGCEESMDYGMPVYKRNGVVEAAFASQKQYVALYGAGGVVDEFRKLLPGANIGKGCIRFAKPEKIDFGVLKKLLRRMAESKAHAC